MLLTNSLPYTQSGYAQRSHALLRHLVELGVGVEAWTRLGWPATVGRLGAPDTNVLDGVSYHRLRAPRLPHLLDERWQLHAELWSRALANLAPDVLHTTTDYSNAVVTEAVARSLGVPWVYEMRGQLELTWLASRPLEYRAATERSEKLQLWRAREVEMAAAADAVVVLSQVQAEELVTRGVDRDRVLVVPNGVDGALLEGAPNTSQARRRLGLPDASLWVGAVSSLVGYEGFDTLLRAVAMARSAGVDVRCLLVGDGVSRPELVRLGQELGLGSALVMPGRLPRSEAVTWLSALDVFATPRRDTPVCRVVTPMKIVEALALGKTVLASDLPALAEVLAGTGALLPADDPVAWAAHLRALAVTGRGPASSDAARVVAAGRSWAKGAGRCKDLYVDLIGSER